MRYFKDFILLLQGHLRNLEQYDDTQEKMEKEIRQWRYRFLSEFLKGKEYNESIMSDMMFTICHAKFEEMFHTPEGKEELKTFCPTIVAEKAEKKALEWDSLMTEKFRSLEEEKK